MAQYSFAQNIAGSPHDFSSTGWADGQICNACHTPHEAKTAIADAPLWNHEPTLATFTPYSSGTLTATDVAQPDGTSKLCLSCHDGTIAVDNFGGVTTGTNFVTTPFSNDLSNDHPISFVYNDALAALDGGLNDATSTPASLSGTIEAELLFGATGSATLECASCHDVHDAAGLGALGFLLRVDNTASALCLTCHNK